MIRKYGLPIFAALGLIFGISVVIYQSIQVPTPPIAFLPPTPPYTHYIAGEGVIEAESDNIQIGTPFAEVITDVYVKVGDCVKENDPLFKLDVRTFEAQLYQSEMDRAQAIVEYENQKTQLELYNSLDDRRAVSENDYNKVFYAAESAKVSIAQAEAMIEVSQSYIDRSTIRAPMNGKILQVNIHPGETANLNPFTQLPLIYFGPVCPLHVRINIDEDDAWRYRKGSPALAFVRGNSSISFPLHFVRIEPLIIPKQSLTGSSTERVDTRVLQVIYAFDWDSLPVYVGQILDVFIESIPADTRYDGTKKYIH